jgi:hypothetical protein
LTTFRADKAIPQQESFPTVSTQPQMMDYDNFNQTVMEEAGVGLLPLITFSHFIQTVKEVMRHIQREIYEIHKQTEMVKKH